MPWTLCTTEDVRALIPVEEGNLKDEWSDFAEGLIRQHKSNPNLGVPAAVANEYHNGDGSNLLFVDAPPISSVSSLLVEGAALTSADYIILNNGIQLLNGLSFPKGTANVVITYTSGSAVVDATVRLAAASMVAAIWIYQNRQGADASIRWGNVTANEAGEATPVKMMGLVANLKSIMHGFLRRDRVRAR